MKVLSVVGKKTYMNPYHFIAAKAYCHKCGSSVTIEYTDVNNDYPQNTKNIRAKIEANPCPWCGRKKYEAAQTTKI